MGGNAGMLLLQIADFQCNNQCVDKKNVKKMLCRACGRGVKSDKRRLTSACQKARACSIAFSQASLRFIL